MAASETASGSAGSCLNCGTALTGRYCSACGQPAQLKPLSFWRLVAELVEDIWDVDSKAWRSLLPLMFRPGYLTNQYLAGRRARYVAPLRLYLTASVLFFIVAAITDNNLRVSWGDADLERERIEAASDQAAAGIIIAQEGGCDAILQDTENRWLVMWRERAVSACKKVTADSGESLERAAVDNIPIMMVIFIPVLALVMKLLYPLSKRFYVEHLVFFLHYHAFGFFMLMLLIFVYEAGEAVDWTQTAWRAVAIPASGWMQVYLFFAMWKVYGQGFFTTAAKFFLLFIAYISGLALSLSAVVLYTAMTM